VIKLEDFLT